MNEHTAENDAPTLTPEQHQHALRVIGETFDLAAFKIDSGRSSMPIKVDDALLLAALATHGLTRVTPSGEGNDDPTEVWQI